MIGRFARNRSEEQEPEEPEREHVRREPLPLSRAILWKPLSDSYHFLASMMQAPERQASLFVLQRAFLQVERHLRSGPDLELGGFLAGQLYECPRMRARYAVVNTVVPFADVREEAIGSRVTQEAFDSVQKRLRRHELSLIGWYRNGNGLGLQLLPDDVETHMTYFDRPWQTTMIVVQTPAKSKGAFFTYDPRVGRSYCIPFYELFDTHAAEANRLDRTCVSWATYVPAAAVKPLAVAEKEIVEATVAPIRAPEPEPEPPEPIDEWWDAIKDPWVKLKGVAAPTPPRDDPVPLVWESAGQEPQATPRQLEPKFLLAPIQESRSPDELAVAPREVVAAERTEAPSPAAVATPIDAPKPPPAPKPIETAPVPPVAQRIEHPRPQPVRPAPPFAGPPRGPARTPTPVAAKPVARAVEHPAPQAITVVPLSGAPRSQPQPHRAPPPPRPIAPAMAEAMRKAAATPALALPPGFHTESIRRRRRWRIGFAVAAASFLAVIVLSTIRARASRSAQTPPAQTPPAPVAVPNPPIQSPSPSTASLNGDVILALPVAVDSLSGALSYYREIEADHLGGLVGCRVLDRAFRLVGHARTRVDSARGRVAGALDAADSIRVSMLRAEYTHVAQTYRRSGCAG